VAIWSTDVRACKTTWTTLLGLQQIRATFAAAGAIPMGQLAFWTGQDDTRAVRAQALALEMDQIFFLRGAAYEEGVDGAIAVAALVDMLLVETKVVAELAERADTLYDFLGESEGGGGPGDADA
jgi:hypothetical protein